MEIITHKVEETEQAGAEFAKRLYPGAIVAMYGGLGSGKTAFVRGMARGLNSPDRVTSPTFTIVNEYAGSFPLFHFDMYRLGSANELFDIGWDDYLARGGICVVEWSENVGDAFDGTEIKVVIEKLSDTERKIIVSDPN
ncbi:MAG: tRNA (adenosine(37)-N6)-threonylcarbamoyltransferase complex ATPase subunit type 1 TsaE [Clostridiales bacterium]|jgi:tRNA threonylcarbamoyladenosine biosynthesis protein TsaE|nr:tRNA (adenosine(37)-N6)-threonylcarbamoyltransferase complex ATPase subunit type 1 TsaE [Clostridiales bacterium]